MRRYAPARVTVLAGAGGNGGGGLAAARHLANRGIEVSLTLTRNPDRGSAAERQLIIARRMGLPVAARPQDAHLIVDALIGYGLADGATGRAAGLIGWANQQPAPVLSLDVPSGLDATTGSQSGPRVAAGTTLALALPKTGQVRVGKLSEPHKDELYVGDIGIPPAVYALLDIPEPRLFRESRLVRIR